MPRPGTYSEIIRNAKALRQKMTDAEVKLWRRLRDRQFEDFKFRRQHPIGRYVVDFYCHQASLAIELDGGQHAEDPQEQADRERDAWLRDQGVSVLRFWNNQVINETESVLQVIYDALTHSATHPANAPPPLSPRERGRG